MSDEPGWFILNVRGGARVCVPAVINRITPYVLLEQEDWFEDEIRFVRRWLRPGMRAVDAGASYGLYTIAMARAVGREGRVWAFEPTPRTADHLQRSLELNDCGHVELHRAAVSNRDGVLTLAAGTNSELNLIVAAGAGSGNPIQVNAVTLDRIAASQGWIRCIPRGRASRRSSVAWRRRWRTPSPAGCGMWATGCRTPAWRDCTRRRTATSLPTWARDSTCRRWRRPLAACP